MNISQADIIQYSLEERTRQIRRCLESNRHLIHKVLREIGATSVRVEYCGAGDEGVIERIEVMNGKTPIQATALIPFHASRSSWDSKTDTWKELSSVKMIPLKEALDQFVIDWLECEYPGWDLEDGASGYLSINVAADRFRLGHTIYRTESDYEERTL
ncbi:MAG: hypothetical protein JST16_18230 [Bdellovibrionales bacterium]|nr:hypothetical protein [Bdellovibrionales bacterium]